MDDIIRVQDQFYVRATSRLADPRTRVLKHDDTFAVFDVFGDVEPIGLGEQGIYDRATRFLSYYELRLGNAKPLLLSSTVKDDNLLMTADLTNGDSRNSSGQPMVRGILHLFRSKFLKNRIAHEKLRVTNFSLHPVDFEISFRFAADFADVFEVRGIARERRGRILPPLVNATEVVLNYEGLDEVVRRTALRFSPEPQHLTAEEARYQVHLEPHAEQSFYVCVGCGEDGGSHSDLIQSFEQGLEEIQVDGRRARLKGCTLHASHEPFNELMRRSASDLLMMVTDTSEGMYPYAGIPWYNTVFGRDGLITALQALWLNPELGEGVLKYLAANQATELRPDQDAEPGKILHEMRQGEMVALGEVPFERYYGSIDSTPLFLVLAAKHYERTGNRALLEQLWPHYLRALEWIDHYGDRDGDGFLEYQKSTPKGLDNQGWKDSHDSVSHQNGELAKGPIALCEVQGYVFEAKLGLSRLARVLGQVPLAERLEKEAEKLRQRFEEAFWCEDLGTYAEALDGDKRPCRIKSSNPGHCLWSGIASPERAARTAEALTSQELFSGWGIRTLGRSERRFNPMSYHNGSIWPHDNAIIAAGFSRYGFKQSVIKVFDALFESSLYMDLHRLPELFCGFVRRPGEGPTLYPVACSPQAWAAGSVFMILEAALGVEIDGCRGLLKLRQPRLPSFASELELRNLRVGTGSIDLLFRRAAGEVGVHVLERRGAVEVLVSQ